MHNFLYQNCLDFSIIHIDYKNKLTHFGLGVLGQFNIEKKKKNWQYFQKCFELYQLAKLLTV